MLGWVDADTGNRGAINPTTVSSLLIEMISDQGRTITHGTAFLVKRSNRYYLVTNRHNVTGKNANNNTVNTENGTGAVPEALRVHYQYKELGKDLVTEVPLYTEGEDRSPLWCEHPVYGRYVDVVSILTDWIVPGQHLVQPYSVDTPDFEGQALMVTNTVYVVGFPFYVHRGLQGAATLISGSIATEPALNYNELPCMLLDARTRKGQSGSPVVYHRPSSHAVQDRGPFYQSTDLLLGIYSGRIDNAADLGFIWKPEAIRDVIDGNKFATLDGLVPLELR